MADDKTRELMAKEKQEVTPPAEQTKPGPVFTPAVDIFETDKEITLLADLPGVKAEDLNIYLNEDILTIAGYVAEEINPNEEDILTEYETGQFHRKFTLSEVIDQEKIKAELKDGVLTLRLPKVEKARPRKVTVNVE